MKDRGKGLLTLLLVVVVFAAMAVVALIGIGKNHKGSAENIRLGLDLAGGVSITYEAKGEKDPTSEQMADTVYKLQKRVDNYSTEAAVYQEGSNRINVDIPGVTDADQILRELGKAGAIAFKDETGKTVIDGSDVTTAKVITTTQNGPTEYMVELQLNAGGAKKFSKATADNLLKPISIVYDGETISSPVVQEQIKNGVASISGQESFEEADKLASTIRIGALPLELQELRSNVVGAKLGIEAINTSLLAGLIGFIIVLIFMTAFYRIPGLASSIALAIYVVAILLVLNVLNVTLTLPGIAGIILSIGMAVDANVIIFTRVREELATGKTIRSSMKVGFEKALSAIIDGNVTTLIAAAVLWFMGSGTVKGFAQTLAIGIVLSMITALFVTRFILNALYNVGFDKEKYFGVQKPPRNINYVKHFKTFGIISLVLILAGVGAIIFNKTTTGDILNFGLDFRGGTSMEVAFNEPITRDLQIEVGKLVKEASGENAEISEIKGSNSLVIKTKEMTQEKRNEVEEKLVDVYKVDGTKIATESISGAVSDEMKRDAIVSVIIAGICMLIYIWIRFKDIKFGASAVIALLHDVLIVLMVYAVLRISVGNTFIACMLTIVGYSINSTIVIFDRIRENRKAMRNKDLLIDVVNGSINQTLSRSINTSLTTLVMVVVLAILGVDSVKEFAIPLIAGIVSGAYASVCITGGLWYFFKTKIGKNKTLA